MDKKEFFKKIKTGVIKGAKTSAFKIEEAAKIGKMHLKIISEKKKLNAAYQIIGRETVKAAEENKLSDLDSKQTVKDNIKKIEEISGIIESLERELSGNNAT